MPHSASLTWNQTGLSFNGTVDHHVDTPIHFGWSEEGKDDGISPMGMILASLAACTAMDVVSILQKKRQNVTAFSIDVEGTQATEHPKVYKDITLVYRVTGEAIDPEAVARAIELSTTKYCSVHGMLHEVAQIQTRYEILTPGAESQAETEPEIRPFELP
jgi:putative redox protein